MSQNKSSIVGWAGVVLAILAILIGGFLWTQSGASSSSTGSVNGGGPVFNAGAYFPKGFVLGGQKTYSTADQIVINRGQNQGIWTNRTGQTAYITEGDIITNGAASSTINLYVGTTSTTTLPANGKYITDTFTPGLAPFFAQFINATTSTSTPAGVIGDNNAQHLGTNPSGIAVPNGSSLLFVIGSFCKADGACNTATSTNRGFNNAILNFTYNLGLPL